MFLVVSGLVHILSKLMKIVVLASKLPVKAMLPTVISYLDINGFSIPVQLAAILVPVELIF